MFADHAWGFDTGLEGWQIYELTPASALIGTQLSWNAQVGNPEPGSIRFEIPFTDVEQQMRFGLRLAEPINLSGKRLSVSVLLESGLNVDPAQPGGAQVYASSGDEWVWASGPWLVVNTVGDWVQGQLEIDAPEVVYSGFDSADIREIGVMVQTGRVGEHNAAVVYVDSFTVSGQ